MAVELSGTTQPKQKSNTNDNKEFKFPPKDVLLKRQTGGDDLPLASQG